MTQSAFQERKHVAYRKKWPCILQFLPSRGEVYFYTLGIKPYDLLWPVKNVAEIIVKQF